MPLLPIPSSHHSHGAVLRRRCRMFACFSALLAAPAALHAQIYQTHTEDAAPVPAGFLRLRATTSWTRFDERFTATGRRTLAEEISTGALGVDQFPLLAPADAALRTLSNSAGTRLSFGSLATESDARVVRTPIALEYGITRRLSIGVSVPFIQTRRSIALRVNADSSGNVGFVPERLRQTAAQANNSVYTGFRTAADSIGRLLANCPASPNANGCAAVLANTADATAARLAAQQFADAVKTALGTDPTTAFMAPMSALAAQIDARRTALNASVQKYLGASAGATANVFTAPSHLSYIDLQGRNGVAGLLQSPLGGGLDSLRTIDRVVVGGATVGAQLLVLDNFASDSLPPARVQTRLMIGGAYRFEPVFADSGRTLGSISPTDGSAVELRTAMDVVTGHFGTTVAARYTHPFAQTVNAPLFGDPEAFWIVPVVGPISRTAGAQIGVDVTPRLLIGDWFALNGHYGFERTGATTYDRIQTPGCMICGTVPDFAPNTAARTAQRAGFGIRYSTVESFARGMTRLPLEVSFTHLETFSGDAGLPKVRVDQIQMRLYYRLIGRR